MSRCANVLMNMVNVNKGNGKVNMEMCDLTLLKINGNAHLRRVASRMLFVPLFFISFSLHAQDKLLPSNGKIEANATLGADEGGC